MVDHFVFSSRRFSQKTKSIVFGVIAGTIVGMFWWFKGAAFGMEGPIKDHWGMQWRKVRQTTLFRFTCVTDVYLNRAGTSTLIDCTSVLLWIEVSLYYSICIQASFAHTIIIGLVVA